MNARQNASASRKGLIGQFLDADKINTTYCRKDVKYLPYTMIARGLLDKAVIFGLSFFSTF